MDTETVNKFILEKLMELLLVFDNFFGYLEEKWNTVVPAELWHSKIYPWLLNVGLPVVMGVLLLLLLFWIFKILLLCFFRVCNILLMGIFSLGRICLSCCCFCSSETNEETYIMNCDASDKQHNPKLGSYYGALIRDSRGEVIAAAIGRSERVNINVHELQGLETGLKLAKSYGIRRIIVRADSQNVVDLVHKKYSLKKDAVSVLLDRILRMVDQLEDFDIKHIDREDNCAADELAKFAENVLGKLYPDTEYMKIPPSHFSEPLKKKINGDKMRLFHN